MAEGHDWSVRITEAQALFEQEFGQREGLVAVVSPGRTEIAGNHTDHEGGHVIAGALDVAVVGVAAPNGTNVINVASEGFSPVAVAFDPADPASLSPREDERVTTAGLVRGMAALLAERGRVPAGFDLAMTSDIPSGGGLSSSAAVECALGRAMEALWEGPAGAEAIGAADLARLAQRCENDWFGKPCGLMDQMSVAQGAVCFMDFHESEARIQRIEFDFAAHGYDICLVDVGCDHSRFTDEYAAVPVEMQAVARELGATRLSDVAEEDFEAAVPALRTKLGDRAILRAAHYYLEESLVDQRRDALLADDVETFLALTRRSGMSSGMFLQNVSAAGAYQPATLALGVAELALAGRGAVRIHGGGFGGTIQAFVPHDLTANFVGRMDAALGAGSTRVYGISEEGARAWQL